MSDPQEPPTPERLLAEQDFVRGVVRSLLRGDEAEDVVQRTWLRAVRRTLPASAGLRPWLARIARNLVRDGRRDAQRRAARELAAAKDEALPSTLDVLAREAERRRVVDAVLALPEPYRGAVLARFWDDTPLAALAKRLDVPDATVRSWLRRGLSMLRARLDADRDGGRWRAALAPLLFEGGLVVSKSKLAVAGAAAALIGLAFWWSSWPESIPPEPPVARGEADPRQVQFAGEASTDPAIGERAATTGRAPLAAALAIEVVVTQDGLPAPGLALELRDFAGAGTDGKPGSTHALLTDERGRAALRVAASDELRTLDLLTNEPARRVWCTPLVVAPDESAVTLEATTTRFGCTLRGVVRDERESPIEGATISFNGWHEAQSDPKGRYELPIGTGAAVRPVLAYAPGFRQSLNTIAVPEGAREHVLDLVLSPGASITGRVVDGAGDPISGVEVRTSGSFRRHASDNEGRFVLDHLEPGSKHQVTAESRAYGVASTIADAGEDVTLTLSPGLRVAGRVRDPSGRPIAGAAVGIYAQSSGVRTRAWSARDGSFAVTGLSAGELELVVRRRGFAHAVIPLALTSDRDGLLVDLTPGRSVRGKVLDDRGAPIAGVSIFVNLERMVMARTASSSVASAADGGFEHHAVPSEPCTIHAYKDGWQSLAHTLDGLGDVEVELRMTRAAGLAGRVLDAVTRKPVPEFNVTALPIPTTARLEPVHFAAPDGTWSMRGQRIKDGLEFEIVVRAPGYAPGRIVAIATASPDPERAVVLLAKGVVLTGSVLDAVTGAPIAGAGLAVQGEIQRGTTTDAAGRFSIEDLGPGPTSLLVRAQERPVLVHTLEIPAAAATHEIEIRVGPGVTVQGRLVGFDGLRHAHVLLDMGDDSANVPVAADGSFAVTRVGPGTRSLYLSGGEPASVVRVWRLVVTGSEPATLALAASEGDASLSVTVHGLADGEARVVPLGEPRTPLSLPQHHLRFTGGAFRVDGLAPGRYRVRVTGERREAAREIDVDGETTLTVDVPR